MKIVKITVGSKREVYNAKATCDLPYVEYTAELEEGDDPAEVTRKLRLDVETALAQHADLIKANYEILERIGRQHALTATEVSMREKQVRQRLDSQFSGTLARVSISPDEHRAKMAMAALSIPVPVTNTISPEEHDDRKTVLDHINHLIGVVLKENKKP